MIRRYFSILLIAGFQMAAATESDPPKDATGWFVRARDLFNIREQGAAPFHLRATFIALPGLELQKKKEVLAGKGVYDETWLAPHQWRREVTFGPYHAVEVQSGRDRKMEASSDYEPSRVLMLLEALLEPVPRNLIEPELNDVPQGWKVEQHMAGKLPFVRIGRTWAAAYRTFSFGYLLLNDGVLVQSNQAGLITGWEDEISFQNKAVPRRITVAAGQRPLLTVDVTIEPSGEVQGSQFELAGPAAEPGMSLRPFHKFETHGPELLDGNHSFVGRSGLPPFVMRQIIDRHGIGRELEVIAAPESVDLSGPADGFRRDHWRAATIDRSACEIVQAWYF